MFERILVPLDGSRIAEMVLPYVCEFTSLFNSHTTLLCVPDKEDTAQKFEKYVVKRAEKLGMHLKKWHPNSNGMFKNQVLIGKPATTILDYASRMECDLIIAANRGASNQSLWALGNVANKIIRYSDFPVLLIKNPVDFGRLRERKIIKKIMVPLDGSRLSEAAIPIAEEIHAKTNAEIILFRVIDPQTVMSGPGLAVTRLMVPELGTPVITNSAIPFVVEYMKNIRASLVRKGINTSFVINQGIAADNITEYAYKNSVDVVVMSSHGWSGIGRWVFGSVTEKVVQLGKQPVLVVRPTGQ